MPRAPKFIKKEMWIEVASGLALYNIIGGLWYSPVLFQRTFLQTTPFKKDADMKPWMLLATFILGGLEVFGLYHALFNVVGVKGGAWREGGWWGYLIWQFFVFPSMAVHYLFDRSRPVKHLLLVSGHHLTTMVLEGFLMTYLYQ